jgi:hypothetical protein
MRCVVAMTDRATGITDQMERRHSFYYRHKIEGYGIFAIEPFILAIRR